MNKDTMKGAVIDAVGKLQRKLGELMGSPKQEVKGAAKQAVGKTQKAVGKTKTAASKTKAAAKKARVRAGAKRSGRKARH